MNDNLLYQSHHWQLVSQNADINLNIAIETKKSKLQKYAPLVYKDVAMVVDSSVELLVANPTGTSSEKQLPPAMNLEIYNLHSSSGKTNNHRVVPTHADKFNLQFHNFMHIKDNNGKTVITQGAGSSLSLVATVDQGDN